jgi:8-oxo-dGTP diphosphatase
MMSQTLPRIGSALLVRDATNRIILGKRCKDPERGAWVIPGGGIRAFETIANAGIREFREETGFEVSVQGIFRVYELINPPDEHRIVIYSWALLTGGGQPKAGSDISELGFFLREDLPHANLSYLTRQVLTDAGLLIS